MKELFGVTKAGVRHYGVPGKIYIYKGKRYIAYTPSWPFTRQLFPTPEGLMALGKYKKTYLVPENVYNSFREFSMRGNKIIAHINHAVGWWKTWAILSHFPTFNINNFVGDTMIMMLQAPEPHLLGKEIGSSEGYLVKLIRGENKDFSMYEKGLHGWMVKNNILEAGFVRTEVKGRMREIANPYKWFINKSWKLSAYREAWDRTIYASYLYREGVLGDKGSWLIKAHPQFDTKGLSESDALGKIARDLLVDYSAQSKAFRRYVRGFAFPFSTWYFNMSATFWRLHRWKIGKTLAILLAPYLFASYWNDRNKKQRELEQLLPDHMRDQLHFVLGEEPGGKIRVWRLQWPTDILIGTKIYGVATDQTNRVILGEKTIKEAAIDTIKGWGIREAKGIAFLIVPAMRYIKGLIDRRDPWDHSPLYPTDPSRMDPISKLSYQSLFMLKTFVPFMTHPIYSIQTGEPMDVTTKKILDTWAGKRLFGIYDLNKKAQVIFKDPETGKEIKIDWDDLQKMNYLQGEEQKQLARIENAWVDSGQLPSEFIKTDKYKKLVLEMYYDVWGEVIPELKETSLSEEELIAQVEIEFGERLANSLGWDAISSQRWLRVQLERAKTAEEKKKIGELYDQIRKERILDVLQMKSKTAREIYLLKLIMEKK